jgi:hypothetical protein
VEGEVKGVEQELQGALEARAAAEKALKTVGQRSMVNEAGTGMKSQEVSEHEASPGISKLMG